MFELILIAVFCLVLFSFGLTSRKPRADIEPPATKPSDDAIHQSYERTCLFSNRAELAFFHALRTKLPAQYHVLTKVRMEDIVKVDKTIVDRKKRYGLRGRVKSRHVDFCIIDDKGHPHMVIELDGQSHNTQQAKNGDVLKDGIFKACDIPFVRVRTGQDFHAWAYRIVAGLPQQVSTQVPPTAKNLYSLPA